MAKGRTREMKQLLLPKFDYYLDNSDPDIVILRRQDGAFVAAFSARGATREGIVEAAKEDYGRLIEAPPRTFWVFEETAPERGALNPGAPLFTQPRRRGSSEVWIPDRPGAYSRPRIFMHHHNM
jgi:hypothetical protein